MKAPPSIRPAASGALDRTHAFEQRLDREVDDAVRHLMTQSPPSRVYSVVAQSIRQRPEAAAAGPSTPRVVAGFAVASALLLAVAVLAVIGSQAAVGAASASASRGILLLTWVSNTELATWINESESVFAYPGILFLHTFGLATVVGLSLAINGRLLGIAPRISVTSLRRLVPYIWFGFFVNLLSGGLLLIANAREALNPLFGIKLALVAFGVLSMTLIDRELWRTEAGIDAGRADSRRTKLLGAASLVVWIGAIVAGRLLAYVHGN